MSLLLQILGFINPLNLIGKVFGYFRRPKLNVYFDPNETYRIRTIANEGNVPGFFCHLMVSNTGKQIAKKCRARVIEIAIKEQNMSYRRHPGFSNPFVLKWAHEPDYSPKDIENDLPTRLDLCYSRLSTPDILIFFTDQKPDGNLKIYPRGDYRVKIRVDSTNAKPVDKFLIIKFTGDWNKIVIEDFNAKSK